MHEGKIRFLADESCDFTVVRSLRSAGYDVVAVTESFPADNLNPLNKAQQKPVSIDNASQRNLIQLYNQVVIYLIKSLPAPPVQK